MRKIKSLLIALTVCVLSLSSCDQTDSDLVYIEVYAGAISHELRVYLAAKAETEQNLLASFDLYPGAPSFYYEKWENGTWEEEWNFNTSDGSFKLVTRIQDNYHQIIDEQYLTVSDFPNTEKYIVTLEKVSDDSPRYIVNFGDDYITVTYDFSTLDMSNGYILFYFAYLNNEDNSAFLLGDGGTHIVIFSVVTFAFTIDEDTVSLIIKQFTN